MILGMRRSKHMPPSKRPEEGLGRGVLNFGHTQIYTSEASIRRRGKVAAFSILGIRRSKHMPPSKRLEGGKGCGVLDFERTQT